MITKLAQVLRSRLRFKLENTATNRNVILCRTACLGNNTFGLTRFNQRFKTLNLQKNRIDWDIQPDRKTLSALLIAKHFPRRDICKIISLQKFSIFNIKLTPKAIIIDTYSELTDQKFEVDGKFFFSSFSDFRSKGLNYTSHGLLQTTDFANLYRTYFEKLRSLYKNDVPIIVILFPAALDPRKKFQQRAEKIREAIHALSSDKSLALRVLDIPNSDVEGDSNDKFYYHFSHETYQKYAIVLEKLLDDLEDDYE